MAHGDTVRQIYEAFGRGDVPAILRHFSDDIDWEYGLRSTHVPWLQPGRGLPAAGRFFEALRAVDIHAFSVKAIFESGNIVVALIDLEATVRRTGRRVIEEDEAHIWYFDEAGKVSRFRHRADTHQHWLAYQGSEA